MSTDTRIRRAIANTTKGEAARLTLPDWVRDLDLDAVDDVLGWRDPKAPARGVLLVPGPEDVVGIALRAGDGAVRTAAMCALCRTTHTDGDVTLYTAPKAGAAGRDGNSVGTYVCDDLACPTTTRLERKPSPSVMPDLSLPVAERVAGLRVRVDGFLAAVRGREDAA